VPLRSCAKQSKEMTRKSHVTTEQFGSRLYLTMRIQSEDTSSRANFLSLVRRPIVVSHLPVDAT